MTDSNSIKTASKSIYQKSSKYITEHKIVSTIIALVVILGGFYIYKSYANVVPTTYNLSAVSRDTIVTSISGTGQVSAQNQLGLTAQSSGQVTSIKVQNGDMVKQGDLLLTVDNRAALVSLTQAQANVTSAQANYDKLINGDTSQDLAVTQLSVNNARQNLLQQIESAEVQAENTIRTSTDQLFGNPQSNTPQFELTFYDSQTNAAIVLTPFDINQKQQVQSERSDITKVLNDWKTSISGISSSTDAIALADMSQKYLDKIQTFTNDLSAAINAVSFDASKYKSNVDSFKSSVASARSSIQNLSSGISSAEQSYTSSQSQLVLKQAPARPEDIASSEASLESSKASLSSAQNNYDNTIIRAPFDGQVASIAVQKGDQVSSGTVVVTMTTQNKIATLPLNEVDVAKVKLGDPATLTFDALPDITLTGKVIDIDLLGTVTQGVVNYTVKIGFDLPNDQVKPNMSVNASIITNTKTDVLVVPNSSIKTQGNNSYVLIPSANESISASSSSSNLTGITLKNAPVSQVVQIGLSNDTETEITSGLDEGQLIITKTTNGSAVTTASSAKSGLSLLGGGGGAGGAGRAATGR